MNAKERTARQLAACRRAFGDRSADASKGTECGDCGAITGWAHAPDCQLDRYPALSASPIYV